MNRPCVFFDRDGVVNISPGPGYVERWEDFHLMPGIGRVLQTVVKAGYAAVVISNQRGVAIGRMTANTVDDIHNRLREQLRREYGVDFLDILYCPHDRDCRVCRKPQPGMLLEAARRHELDLGHSWIVGDQERDIEAGLAAGCRGIRIAPPGTVGSVAEHTVHDMAQLNRLLKKILRA